METFSDPDQPLHELSTLLKNSINFPCSSFVFRDVEGSTLNLEPQFFLNAHGSLLKKLELDSFGCSILLEDLRRLLLVQAPNLEHFVLAVSVVYSKKKRRVKRPANYDSDSYTSPSSDSSPDASEYEYEESQDEMTPHQKDGKSARGQNTPISLIEPADRSTKLNLKVLEIGRNIRISQRILREILDASPKLTQVKIVHNEYLHLLVKPVNRLHLLKELETRGQHRSIRSLEILAEHHQGNWALRKLNFEDTYCTDSVIPRMRTAMNKILAGCSKSKSLTKLHWGNLSEPKESLPELELPQMPHVQQLVLSHSYYSRGILFVTPKFFPSGIRLKTTFPNLKILRFSCLGKKIRLDQLLDDDDLQPVESVTKVAFDSMRCKPNRFVDKDSFKAMFPNASFWYKEYPECGKGFFYPIFE